jgi:hypothetical protein
VVKVSSKEKLEYLILPEHQRDFELETFLTLRYDNHGQLIHQHDPNAKKRSKGGWTTYYYFFFDLTRTEYVVHPPFDLFFAFGSCW